MKGPLLLSILLLLISCQDDDTLEKKAACESEDPTVALDWLRDEINDRETNPTEETKYCYIERARFQGQDVFIYSDCNPFINKVLAVFDCEGLPLGFIGIEIPQEALSDFCVIWRPKDFACLTNFSCIDE